MNKKPENIREDIYGRANVEDTPELLSYYEELKKVSTDALWTVANAIEPWEPVAKSQPMIWHFKDLRELVIKSAKMVDPAKAGRRVVMLVNPGVIEHAACVGRLFSGIQTMCPGEFTSAHRHMASALRFIMEGSGAYTVVAGHRIDLKGYDLVLTPRDCWHDHGVSEDGTQCIWQDGLDIPLMNTLETNFYDVFPSPRQTPKYPSNDMPLSWGNAAVLPAKYRWQESYSPVMRYPFDKTYEALQNLAKVSEGDPFDDMIVRYANPLTGGHVMDTMGASLQMLRPGIATKSHRHTGNVVYQVAQGQGYSMIGGKRFDWEKNDIFVIPSFVYHQHTNLSSTEEACLFSFNDFPVVEKLGLCYEQAEEGGQRYQGRP